MTQTLTPVVTRRTEYPGYDTLGDADNWGEDFHLLVDGDVIGGTYWCSAENYKDGERWASYGPAGYSFKHRTREDAERVQLTALGIADDVTVTTETVPAPVEEGPVIDTGAYEAALKRAKDKGVGRCDDAAAMAAFCQANLPILVGAVSPQLVWEGAQKKGLTFLELGRLVKDPMAIDDLQWV